MSNCCSRSLWYLNDGINSTVFSCARNRKLHKTRSISLLPSPFCMGFLPLSTQGFLHLVPNWVSVEGFPLILAGALGGREQFAFIIFIYCFIVRPFGALIVIRSRNKPDLLWSPVGWGCWPALNQNLWAMNTCRDTIWVYVTIFILNITGKIINISNLT